MQIQGIQAVSAQMSMSRMDSASLTEDQKTQLEEILSRYDPENLSVEDRQAMMEEIRAAGIQPGSELFSALEEAGFKGPEGPPPPPPDGAGMAGATEEQVSSFMEILEGLMSGELTEEEASEQVSELKDQLTSSIGQLVDNTI